MSKPNHCLVFPLVILFINVMYVKYIHSRTLTTLVPPSKAAGRLSEDEWLFICDYFAGLSSSDDFVFCSFTVKVLSVTEFLQEISICFTLSDCTIQKTFSLVIHQKRKYRPRFSTTANDSPYTPSCYTHPTRKKEKRQIHL